MGYNVVLSLTDIHTLHPFLDEINRHFLNSRVILLRMPATEVKKNIDLCLRIESVHHL